MTLKTQEKQTNHRFKIRMNYPCLNDRATNSGVVSGHYFHQDLYAVSQVYKKDPVSHVDIGSRIDGFVAHVASFRKIKVLDIRELDSCHENIVFEQIDLSANLQNKFLDSCDSLSCLHAIEHVGLGRYGDPVNYDGYIKAILNLSKMLKNNGLLYISVPMGKERIEFNAYRVFSVRHIYKLVSENGLNVECISYINDKGDFYKDVNLDDGLNDNYGCIILEMRKE